MPNYAGKAGRAKDFKPLTDREVSDLVAFLAGWRQSEGDKQ
jgi:ribosome modulation factor